MHKPVSVDTTTICTLHITQSNQRQGLSYPTTSTPLGFCSGAKLAVDSNCNDIRLLLVCGNYTMINNYLKLPA